MDQHLRHTPGIIKRIDHLRAELMKHFDTLVSLAAIERTDHNTTAFSEYQIQVETAALVRAAEDVTSLIRQLQEMWLFGKLNTLGKLEAQKQADETARSIGDMLPRLLAKLAVDDEVHGEQPQANGETE